jgi:hypothetical protein
MFTSLNAEGSASMIKSLSNDKVHTLLNPENNVVYRVPKYQREYTWGKAEWDELVDDLLEHDGADGHFLGTIICVNSTANATEESILEVIDGQQRLTTLSLLMSAVHSVLSRYTDQMDFDQQVDLSNLRRMLALRDPWRARVRPQSQGNNDKDYSHVLAQSGIPVEDPKPAYAGNRRIKRAFYHFQSRIEQLAELEGTSQLNASYDMLSRVKRAHLVKLEVVSHADAFTLFESLNNRGVPLTPIDLIKNTLLAEAERTEGTSLDLAYSQWRGWLDKLGDEYGAQERFFRYYYTAMKHESDLAVSGQIIATRSNLIRIYEELIRRDLPKLLTNLDDGVSAFAKLLGRDEEHLSTSLGRSLTRLRRAQGLPAHILLIYLLITQKETDLSDAELIEIVDLQTNFFVRRNLTGKPATYALVRLYMELVARLRDADASERKAIILSELESVSASNDEFYQWLSGPLYDLNAEVVRFILTHLAEQGMTLETRQDLWQRTASTSRPTFVWSIEHILPQGENLPQDWIDMLGGSGEAAKTQQELVHHLGNLTITGYNSALSNASFAMKRDRKDSKGNYIGYRNGLNLNAGLADRETWSDSEILERTEQLAADAMAAFPLSYPQE